jgi:hypothetical protein
MIINVVVFFSRVCVDLYKTSFFGIVMDKFHKGEGTE